MAIPSETLETLFAPLHIVTSGTSASDPVQKIKASIVPSLLDLKATDILTKPLDINLNFLTKGVAFNNDDLPAAFNLADINTSSVDGLPILNLLNSAGLTPGNLGQLAGTLNIPIPLSVTVGASVTWRVTDANNMPVSDYLAPNGLSGFDANFIFPPVIEELTDDYTPSFKEFRIVANVTLYAGAGGVNFNRDLPPIPVFVPSIGVPVILALFRHPFFLPSYKDAEGAVLVIVPANSQLKDITKLNSVLAQLKPVLSLLNNLARFTSLLTGINMLSTALTAQPHIVFRATNSISNLNDIDLISGFWNDIEAEDELASMIFIGNPGKTVECFIDRGFKGGQLNLKIGGLAEGGTSQDSLLTFIQTLEGKSPQSKPLGTEVNIVKAASDFGHELSGIRFV